MKPFEKPLHLRLFLLSRRWHSLMGLVSALLILLLSVTGILLNHKDLFFPSQAKQPLQGLLGTHLEIDGFAVSFADVLSAARAQWGDAPLEKIELKEEGGRLVYKIFAGGGRDLAIDVYSGAWKGKENYRLKEAGSQDKAPIERTINWKKLATDLHSGKIAGFAGRLFMDAVAVVMIVLSLSGLYLWAMPRWKKRQG